MLPIRIWALAVAVSVVVVRGQEPETPPEDPQAAPAQADTVLEGPPGQAVTAKRTQINLLGQTDTSRGESRRNENVQFNLVDNNALKELNVRLGVTATIQEEFEPVRRYFGTEFGNPAGTQLVAVAPDVRAWRGNLFWLHQNSVVSARSFFQVGDVQPARENRYGFAVSGPLAPWLSLTVNASQQKLRGNVNGNVLVPRPDELTALTTEPATRALVQSYLDAYPRELPNRTDINPRALNTNSLQRINGTNAAFRLRATPTSRDTLLWDYAPTLQTVDAFQLVAGQNPDSDIKSHRVAGTWDRAWTANTTTSLSFGLDRLRTLLTPEENAVGPFVSIGGALEGLGPGGSIPIDRARNIFRTAATTSVLWGSHSWVFGGELDRLQLNGRETDVHRGFFSFGNDFGRDAITNLRLGTPSQHIVSIGDVYRAYRNWSGALFAGDTWEVDSRWTLDLGLRWELVGTPTEVRGRDVVPYPCDCNNVSPRFGFAYRAGDRLGVVRGAYGLHYGEIFPATFQQVRFAPPGNRKIVVPAANLVDPLGSVDPADPNIRPTTYILDDDLRAPYSHQYNLSWEFEPVADWRVQLGYVGSRSHKLLLMWYNNRAQVVEGIEQTSRTLNIRRAVDGLADIRNVLNGSIGYYDAARASVVLPRWQGLSLRTTYWFSKALDLGSSYTNTGYASDSRTSRSQTEFDQFDDMKGLSDFDQPHALLITGSYETPQARRWRGILGGWTFSWVGLLKSGTPFTVFSGSDGPGFGNVDGNGGDRPNLLDTTVLGRTIGDPDTSRARLPAAAFGFISPEGGAGNLGRNTFRKGRIANVNVALQRVFPVAQDTSVALRLESVNFLNTPQFAEPGNFASNPNFGAITNTLNDGRTFQATLRLSF